MRSDDGRKSQAEDTSCGERTVWRIPKWAQEGCDAINATAGRQGVRGSSMLRRLMCVLTIWLGIIEMARADFVVVGGSADEVRSSELIPYCRQSLHSTSTYDFAAGICWGYLSAIIDAHDNRAISEWNRSHDKYQQSQTHEFCLKNPILREEVIAIYILWYDNHPDWQQTSARYSISAAFEKAFPCE